MSRWNPAVIVYDETGTEAKMVHRNNAFATLINAQPRNLADELRLDDIAGGDLYIGRAPDTTATSAASWEVVRIYRTATGATTRIRYRTGVVWDNRTAGWT